MIGVKILFSRKKKAATRDEIDSVELSTWAWEVSPDRRKRLKKAKKE